MGSPYSGRTTLRESVEQPPGTLLRWGANGRPPIPASLERQASHPNSPHTHHPMPDMIHRPILRTFALAALVTLLGHAHAANQVFKCSVNGSVSFQSSPCPVDKPSRHPTKDELNAERKKRLAEAAAAAASAPKPPTPSTRPESTTRAGLPHRDSGFRCDGRQHCSQMRSCAEAKFFLAHCPGVKLDGNRDGTPCEQQWCTHPFAN